MPRPWQYIKPRRISHKDRALKLAQWARNRTKQAKWQKAWWDKYQRVYNKIAQRRRKFRKLWAVIEKRNRA